LRFLCESPRLADAGSPGFAAERSSIVEPLEATADL
jgi:hypothetical protein